MNSPFFSIFTFDATGFGAWFPIIYASNKWALASNGSMDSRVVSHIGS